MEPLDLNENRLVTLESRIAFQDQMIEELNGVVTVLRDQIDSLAGKVKSLSLQVSANFAAKDEDLSPPHY